MKPILENINHRKNSSFTIKQDILPYIKVPFHFHPEFELVYIVQGKGKRIVGDCIENFEEGDLVLLGSNLPHVWKNTEEHYQNDSSIVANVIVIHFLPEDFGKNFFLLPEMRLIKELLSLSKYGIKINGSSNLRIGEKMIDSCELSGSRKVIQLLDILEDIQQNSQDCVFLSNANFTEMASGKQSRRLNRVFKYISENYDKKITLQQIADVAHMNSSAFCRYFKQLTGKSFTNYLIEIRINYAKKLLVDKKSYVNDIAYQCGFNSPSYFNKQFKKHEGTSPLEYVELN